jgi:Holliday junction resolvase RusA-like endonuclease
VLLFESVVAGDPVPLGRHRTATRDRHGRLLARPHHFNPKATADYQEKLVEEFQLRIMGHRSDFPLDDPLWLDVEFRLARPRSVHRRYPQTKPDLSNLTKMVEDALEKAGVVVNDSRFVDGTVRKRYSEFGSSPTVAVKIRRLE